ncbi:MAG: type II toxin-antitoxin system death-on-curing family toxin [Methanosarcina sp.]
MGTLELMFEYMLKETNTVFQNAAIVVYTIAGRHPFFNGNKRTGFEAMNYVLEDAGYKITAPAGEVINFIVSVAATEKEISLSEIEQWISKNTSKS